MAAVCVLLSAATASAGHYDLYEVYNTPGDVSAAYEFRMCCYDTSTTPPTEVEDWMYHAIVISPSGGFAYTSFVIDEEWNTAEDSDYVFKRERRDITTPPNNNWYDAVTRTVNYVP